MDNVTISEHFSGLIDARTILVGWSYQGGKDVASGAGVKSSHFHRDGFMEIPLRSGITHDGQTCCWSILIADGDDALAGELPTVRVDAGGRQIGFGISPRTFSAKELPAALSAAARECGTSLTLRDVQEAIQKSKNLSNPV